MFQSLSDFTVPLPVETRPLDAGGEAATSKLRGGRRSAALRLEPTLPKTERPKPGEKEVGRRRLGGLGGLAPYIQESVVYMWLDVCIWCTHETFKHRQESRTSAVK